MLMEANGVETPKPSECDVFIATMGEKQSFTDRSCCLRCADAISVRSMICRETSRDSSNMQTDWGAKLAVVIGDNELENGVATCKDMISGEQTEVRLRT